MSNYNKLSDTDKSNATMVTNSLDRDFQNAIEDCDDRMEKISDSYKRRGWFEVGLLSVGIFAGAVAVPALVASSGSQAWIAGMGGVSGATSAVVLTMDQTGVSANEQAKVYELTVTEIESASNAYVSATNNDARKVAVGKLIVACRFPQLPGKEETREDDQSR